MRAKFKKQKTPRVHRGVFDLEPEYVTVKENAAPDNQRKGNHHDDDRFLFDARRVVKLNARANKDAETEEEKDDAEDHMRKV